MSDELRTRARAIFLELTTLNGPDADAELDRLVGGDATLRAAVERLLDDRDHADNAGILSDATDTKAANPITESPGAVVGPYKVLQRIGEGGFGSVFLAEQTRPVRRRVALKIIKLGMDTKQVIARFEAERQALALMDHPHISRVFDAGATDSGRPYFVMEYVVGDAIIRFADAFKLDISARLALLVQVCSAVQHAHTKGVIHRDLKPANVLVSMVDGKPFAKVIDFGIAKATASPLTDKTLFTEHRQLIGTPEYMSPEQADGSPDIDTRTDVYALGVLFYELLTGATPFDTSRLRSAAWAEMQRIIREEEPPIPSVRLSRDVESLAKAAAYRSVEPPKLSASIRGELDWIVMRALDKDRSRRYATPAQLAEDIERHLAGEAVQAAPPTAGYRLRKFVRRNKGSVIATGAVATALLLGIMGTSAGLWKAHNSNKQLAIQVDLAKSALIDVISAGATFDNVSSITNYLTHYQNDVTYGMTITRNPDTGTIAVVPAGPEYEGRFDEGVMHWLSEFAVEYAKKSYELNETLEAQVNEAEWLAYTANLALAQNAMDAGDWPGAREYLAECPESKRGWEWNLLHNKARSVVREFRGDGTAVSPNGKYILAVAGGEAMIYKTDSDEPPVRIQTDAPLIPSGPVEFSESDEFVALSTWESNPNDDASTRIFRLDGTPVTAPDGPPIPGVGPYLFDWSPDGYRAVVMGAAPSNSDPKLPNNQVTLYSNTGEILAKAPPSPQYLTGVAFHPDGVRIVLTSKCGASIWNPHTGDLTDLPLAPARYSKPWITDDSKYLVLHYGRLHDTEGANGAVVVPLETPEAFVAIAYDPDTNGQRTHEIAHQPGKKDGGPWFATADSHGTLCRWNMLGEQIGAPLHLGTLGVWGMNVDGTAGDVIAWNPHNAIRSSHNLIPIGQPIEWHFGINCAMPADTGEATIVSNEAGIARYSRDGRLVSRTMFPYSGQTSDDSPDKLVMTPAGILAHIGALGTGYGATQLLFDRDAISSQYLLRSHWHATLWADAALGNAGAIKLTAQASATIEKIGELVPEVTSVGALADGSRAFTGVGRELSVWDPASERRIASFRTPYDIDTLELSEDDGILVARLRGGVTMFFDTRSPEAQHADAARFGAEQDAARALVDALLAGSVMTDELETTLVNDESVPPVRKLAAAALLDNRIRVIGYDGSDAFREIANGQTDPAVVKERARTADLPPRIKADVIKRANEWEYSPRPLTAGQRQLAVETKQRRLAEAEIMLLENRSLDAAQQALEIRRELLGAASDVTLEAAYQASAWLGGPSYGLNDRPGQIKTLTNAIDEYYLAGGGPSWRSIATDGECAVALLNNDQAGLAQRHIDRAIAMIARMDDTPDGDDFVKLAASLGAFDLGYRSGELMKLLTKNRLQAIRDYAIEWRERSKEHLRE